MKNPSGTFGWRLRTARKLLRRAEKTREWVPAMLALRNLDLLVAEYDTMVEEAKLDLQERARKALAPTTSEEELEGEKKEPKMSRTPKREIEVLRKAVIIIRQAKVDKKIWYEEEVGPLLEESLPWLQGVRPYGADMATVVEFLMDVIDENTNAVSQRVIVE